MNDKNLPKPSPLAGLKDFQKRTVNYVFEQFYGKKKQTRFLVADEVGLGKTMVARGIIAKTIAHLQDEMDRIDIIYICSNAAIATQNINSLKMNHNGATPLTTRLTLLPRQVRSLRQNKLNFISLTPGTTFDHTRSRGGQMEERGILYQILFDLPLAKGERRERLRRGMYTSLQATASPQSWDHTVRQISADPLDVDLSKDFRRAVMDDPALYAQLKEVCNRFADGDWSEEDSQWRYDLIGKLRNKLASVCLSALEPDLVILDEFQRFKSLLNGDDDAGALAKALFDHRDVRVLLLSATPYKMYTTDQESSEDNHYKDFISTLEFLFNDVEKIAEIEQRLLAIRNALRGSTLNINAKYDLEQALLQVMCRTERIATTRDQNAMTIEVKRHTPLTVKDLQHAANVDSLALNLNVADPLEYWKSAPYLLNFLKSYELRNRLDETITNPSDSLNTLLKTAKKQWLTKGKFEKYKPIDAANPRMRMLFEDTLDKGMWQLLWMPPSLPYTLPGGVYQNKDNLTKTLVFSRWNAVPDAIATICSYEAERRMVSDADITHSKLTTKVAKLLRISTSSKDKRLTGMPVIAWMLPSPTLAAQIDPLAIARAQGGKPLTIEKMRAIAKAKCEALLRNLPAGEPGARADERWYWAAPALLDASAQYLNWCETKTDWPVGATENEVSEPFQDHIDYFLQIALSPNTLGPRPADLADVLCEFALAAPGTCALRALNRINKDLDISANEVLSAAVQIAAGFRTLFNLAETILLLRGTGDDTYWRLTLQYGIDGNLQAVLDEYVHVLYEKPSLKDRTTAEQINYIATHIHSVLSLRPAQLHIDEFKAKNGGYTKNNIITRCRFALRYGNVNNDDKQGNARAETVKDAFNSPFRPFVLASTSLGQEGLDFHTWCHAVMHWNLPSNPVDLEQREGRVHRYKGHAVRKNVAARYGLDTLTSDEQQYDPWKTLFTQAANDRTATQSDLIPYWIFEGPSHVERRIPMLPYSKESIKFKQLKQGLALYRIVFGQPRQEDLLFSIHQQREHISEDIDDWLISLTPPEV